MELEAQQEQIQFASKNLIFLVWGDPSLGFAITEKKIP